MGHFEEEDGVFKATGALFIVIAPKKYVKVGGSMSSTDGSNFQAHEAR